MVGLFSRKRMYEKDGESKTTVDLFLKCGNKLVPVVVKFFDDGTGHDPQFRGRKEVLEAFAEPLPEKGEEVMEKPVQ